MTTRRWPRKWTRTRLTVVWWKDAETLAGWASDAKHRMAQQKGRKHWYEYYKMDVAEIVRVSNFERPEAE